MDLAQNHLGDFGVKEFAKSLRKNKVLMHINFESNGLTDESVNYFSAVFVDTKSQGFFGESKVQGNRSLIEVEGFHFKQGYRELRAYLKRNKDPEPPASVVSTVIGAVNEVVSSMKG